MLEARERLSFSGFYRRFSKQEDIRGNFVAKLVLEAKELDAKYSDTMLVCCLTSYKRHQSVVVGCMLCINLYWG